MKFRNRIAIALLTTVTTFLFGILVTSPVKVFIKNRLQPSPWQVLLGYENQDLEGLDEQSTKVVMQAIQQLTGNIDDNRWNVFEPRIFRTITNTSGEMRYILVEEKPMRMIPDESRLRVHIFDLSGKLLDEEEFGTGLRRGLTSVQIRKVHGIKGEVLAAHSQAVFTGHSVFQVYGLIGDQITLIQLTSGITSEHNDYQSWEIGPKIRHSVDEWEKLLMSGDDAEVMSALIWLNGDHKTVSGEISDEEREVEMLRSRASVRARLAELRQLEDWSWIKQMAETAAKNE